MVRLLPCRLRRCAIELAVGLAATLPAIAAAAEPPQSLTLQYEAFAAGFPVVTFDFRLSETESTYTLDGRIHAVGVLRLFYRVDVWAESEGQLARSAMQPRWHEHIFTTRGKDRVARLDYPGDGTVAAHLVPVDDSGRPKPTAQQTVDTLDPLSAILAIGHAVARAQRCEGAVAVFDGRRRYDLRLTDEGTERLDASPAYSGIAHRCHAAVTKIAGFSFDQDYQPHTSNGRVWFASPRPGAPALPIRIDFDGSWGLVEVLMTKIGGPLETPHDDGPSSKRSALGSSEK